MTVKYLHLRYPKENGVSNRGGATLAYTTLEHSDPTLGLMGDICFNVAWCSERDNFSRKIGRAISSNRLKVDGPYDVIESTGSRTKTLIEWAEQNLFTEPCAIVRAGNHWVIQT